MNNQQLDYLSSEIDDLRQRIDSIFINNTKSQNDQRKLLEAIYKTLWKLIKAVEELKNDKA